MVQRPITVAEYHRMIDAGVLGAQLRRDLILRCQVPLTLPRSEPEPDFAIVERRVARRSPRHPATALLVIEVAEEELAVARRKAAIYASAGVAEYWIVDVVRRCVEVRRDLHDGDYREAKVARRGILRADQAGVTVPVARLFTSRRRDDAHASRCRGSRPGAQPDRRPPTTSAP